MALLCAVLGAAAIAQVGHAEETTRCRLLSGEPQIDYDTVTKGMLSPSTRVPSALSFGKRATALSAVCDVPSHIALTFRGQPGAADAFRFGDQGVLTIQAVQAQLDGRPVRLRKLTAGGTAAGTDGLTIAPGDTVMVAGAADVRGKQLLLQLSVEAALPTSAATPVTEQELNGTTTIELSTR
jgi:hypothetical protein